MVAYEPWTKNSEGWCARRDGTRLFDKLEMRVRPMKSRRWEVVRTYALATLEIPQDTSLLAQSCKLARRPAGPSANEDQDFRSRFRGRGCSLFQLDRNL